MSNIPKIPIVHYGENKRPSCRNKALFPELTTNKDSVTCKNCLKEKKSGRPKSSEVLRRRAT